jgi:hypothetical protein
MSLQERATVLEAPDISVEVTAEGTTRITIDKNIMKKAGHDPDSGDVPDNLTEYYNNGGEKDGLLEIPLKGSEDPTHER